MIRKALVVAGAAALALGAGTGAALADSGADATSAGSPGVLSGNVVQVPIHVPVNACGLSVNLVALLNPALGNACANE